MPRGHRALLDAFAGTEAALAAVRGRLGRARRGGSGARGGRGGWQRRRATGTSSRTPRPSSTALAPEPGEEPALDARRRQLRAAERIREDVARAAEALGPAGAEGPLLQAVRWLETRRRRNAEGLLDPALDGLGRALAELGEVAATVEALSPGWAATRASSNGWRKGSSRSAGLPASIRSRPRRCPRSRPTSRAGSRRSRTARPALPVSRPRSPPLRTATPPPPGG